MTDDGNLKALEILERQRERAIAAWDRFDRISDDSLSDCEDILKAELMAISLQGLYFMQYYLTFDCTCKPDSVVACDVCKAKIKSKSQYREEM